MKKWSEWSSLEKRLLTGTVMIVVFLSLLFFVPRMYLLGIFSFVVALISWEWLRMTQKDISKWFYLLVPTLVFAFLCLLLWLFSAYLFDPVAPSHELLQKVIEPAGVVPAADVKTIKSVVPVTTWSLFDVVVFVFSVMATVTWLVWVPIQLIFFRNYAQSKTENSDVVIETEASDDLEQVAGEKLSTKDAFEEGSIQEPKKAMQWATFATPMVLLFIFWLGSIYLLYVKGPWALLSLWILVWLADTGAYFGGSYLGGPKLAPNVSPNKTISGALCGLISGVLWCVVSYYLPYSFMSYIHSPNALSVVLLGVVLTVVSILGDLYESHIKRIADVKDSSGLLPGHGGIWDRLDSIIAVTPVALLALLWFI